MNPNSRLYKHTQELIIVLDEYTHWFMQLLRRIQYPKSTEELQGFNKPASFMKWLEKAERLKFQPEMLKSLYDVHNDMSLLADEIINETLKTAQTPEYAAFDKLMTFFEEFTLQIRRLGKDMLVEGGGLDDTTGLRSLEMLNEDYDKEMERVARQGKPFSLALVRINNEEEIAGNKKEAIRLVADLIRQSMRSFDDAYRVSDYEFVLSLKQADTDGGVIALKRLQNLLNKSDFEGRAPRILSCISEPAPGDDLDQLIENIRKELDACEQSDLGIIEFTDISPLQRFINQGDGE